MKTSHWILFVIAIAAIALVAMQNKTSGASRLLPFQGRLTDAQGNPITDGPRVVQFKIYDAPVGGSAVWNGEVQKLTVNGGLVSTLLGTKANLASVDFDRELYLELTVDASNDGQITAADPPLLPRQSILPAVFAVEAADSRLLAGQNWSQLFGVNDPSGTLLPGKIAEVSISASKLVPASITAAQIAPQTITAAQLADTTITAAQIAPGTITRDRLEASLTIDSIIPPGTVQAFAGPNIPPGWLLCDGSALDKDRAEYARLFTAIQASWGNGSQSPIGARYPAIPAGVDQTDFNLPDLRGMFLRGVTGQSPNDPSVTGRSPVAPGGNAQNLVGSIQADEIGEHSHTSGELHARIGMSGGVLYLLERDVPSWNQTERHTFGIVEGVQTSAARTTASDVAGTTGGVTSKSTETRPKNAYVHYIIKF